MTSEDNGTTWSAASQLTNGCCSNSPSVVEAQGNTWIAWQTQGPASGLPTIGNEDIFYASSNDDGSAWSAPRRYTRYLGWDGVPSVTTVEPGSSLAIGWLSGRSGNDAVWFGIVGKLEDVNPPITVGSVGHLPAPNPDSDDTVTVSAQVAHETGVGSVELVFSLDGNLQQDLAMFDDGVDGDGSANDGVYAARIGPFPAGTRVEYQVRATHVTGNSVLAPSSSLSFDTLEPVAKTSHVLMVAERHFSQESTPTITAPWTT